MQIWFCLTTATEPAIHLTGNLQGIFQDRIYLQADLRRKASLNAIKKLKPWGIDISSGVETNKLKDKKKIISAVAAARSDMKGVI